MANKKIQGITIEIGGSTTKLNDALKSTNKVIYSTNSELKQLKSALKLDPKNTELLAQKQELLKKNIQESTNRLNALKEAQRQMGAYNSLTDEQKENYRALSVEIAKSETAIKKMNSELRQTNHIDFSKVKATLQKVGDIASEVVKKVGQVAVGVSTAMASVVAMGVKSYAQLEQSIGGVETLFGENAQKVIDNANKAYQTAGVSANEYMQGVTSFSASLLQSLSGDTSKAADIADMAFRDMSDNANKFGTDMSSIQDAYQGFAKQNYTMLDNLKLGYGGTKTEMERLLKDAQEISGVKYDISNLSDVYNAIHVIQEKLKVTGTTAQEASSTISGSANSMKSAFDNFLNGSGTPEQLGSTITTFMNNVANAITKLAPQILSGLVQVIENVAPQLGSLLITLLPQLLEAVQNLINSLFTMISQNVQPIADMVVNLLTSFVDFILQNLPMMIEVGFQLLIALAEGIVQSLPELIPKIIQVIIEIMNIFNQNFDKILEIGVQIIIGIIQGLINSIPTILQNLPTILMAIINFFAAGKLLSVGANLLKGLGSGLIKAIPELIKKLPQIISNIINYFKTNGISAFKNIGGDLIKGLWNGIKNVKNWILDKIKGFGKSILNGLKSFFGIHSPSTVMRDMIGVNLSKGIGLGFEKGMPATLSKVKNAMGNLTSSIKITPSNDLNLNATSPDTNLFTGGQDTFNLTINNNSKYTSPAENARLFRQELQLYQLKHKKVRG